MLIKKVVVTLLLIACAAAPSYGFQKPELKRVSEFKKNKLQDISPDGRILLFYGTSQPVRTYSIPIGFNSYNSKPADDALRLVERTTGREVGRIKVEFYPEDIQFIAGTHRVIYKEPKLVNSKLEWRLKIWDVENGEARECSNENVMARSFTLVDEQHGLTLLRRAEGDQFSILSLPDCRQGTIGPVDGSNLDARVDGNIAVSPDRKTFAYVATNKLIVRNGATLEVIKQTTELNLGQNPLYTPDGKFLVILATNTIRDKPETKRFLLFYDTRNYEIVKRVDVTHWRPPVLSEYTTAQSNYLGTAMAIGPDSRTLAVGYTREKANLFFTTETAEVVIYDLETGAEIARASHPKIKQRPDDPWAASIGKLVFTPDGSQLLSTTNDTLVWNITGTN